MESGIFSNRTLCDRNFRDDYLEVEIPHKAVNFSQKGSIRENRLFDRLDQRAIHLIAGLEGVLLFYAEQELFGEGREFDLFEKVRHHNCLLHFNCHCGNYGAEQQQLPKAVRGLLVSAFSH